MNTTAAEWFVEVQMVRGVIGQGASVVWSPVGEDGSSMNQAQAAKVVRFYKRRGMTARARLGYVDYSVESEVC